MTGLAAIILKLLMLLMSLLAGLSERIGGIG